MQIIYNFKIIMIQKKVSLIITIILLISRSYSSTPGILNVGFDIDDTILFSRDLFFEYTRK